MKQFEDSHWHAAGRLHLQEAAKWDDAGGNKQVVVAQQVRCTETKSLAISLAEPPATYAIHLYKREKGQYAQLEWAGITVGKHYNRACILLESIQAATRVIGSHSGRCFCYELPFAGDPQPIPCTCDEEVCDTGCVACDSDAGRDHCPRILRFEEEWRQQSAELRLRLEW